VERNETLKGIPPLALVGGSIRVDAGGPGRNSEWGTISRSLPCLVVDF
jgi:hypothetical protein